MKENNGIAGGEGQSGADEKCSRRNGSVERLANYRNRRAYTVQSSPSSPRHATNNNNVHLHHQQRSMRGAKAFSNRYRQATITGSKRLKSDFLIFCEQTELNGLLHVPQTNSRLMKSIYILSFIIGTIAVLFLFGKILDKYMADPKGINQEFVTDSPMPFPELNLCRYMVGLSQAQIEAYNISSQLAQVLHWSLEVNYHPGFVAAQKIRLLLNQTKSEFDALKKLLNTNSYSRILQLFLPSYRLIHPMKAVIYEKRKGMYSENYVIENWIMTYMEDLYMYNVICHKMQLPSDSVLALIIPFPPQNDFLTNYTKNYHLLPIMRSYLLMDGNHDVIARIEPEKKYWGSYKLKSSELINSKTHPCQEDPNYYQQHCVMECFGAAPKSSSNCQHCQSVFMHINFGDPNDTELCDPWQWLECNTTVNRGRQGLSVVKCMKECIQACNDESYEYAVSSVVGDHQLSKNVGWKVDPMEISENRSIFILSASKRPNRHVRIRQYPILDLASVFADFGGYMGLFLGSSVLTVVHVLVFWGRSCFLNPVANAVRTKQPGNKKATNKSTPPPSSQQQKQQKRTATMDQHNTGNKADSTTTPRTGMIDHQSYFYPAYPTPHDPGDVVVSHDDPQRHSTDIINIPSNTTEHVGGVENCHLTTDNGGKLLLINPLKRLQRQYSEEQEQAEEDNARNNSITMPRTIMAATPPVASEEIDNEGLKLLLLPCPPNSSSYSNSDLNTSMPASPPSSCLNPLSNDQFDEGRQQLTAEANNCRPKRSRPVGVATLRMAATAAAAAAAAAGSDGDGCESSNLPASKAGNAAAISASVGGLRRNSSIKSTGKAAKDINDDDYEEDVVGHAAAGQDSDDHGCQKSIKAKLRNFESLKLKPSFEVVF